MVLDGGTVHHLTHHDDIARAQRSQERRSRLVAHRANSHEDAEQWDLMFWQSKTPQERLSALVAIRQDVETVNQSRRVYEQHC